MKPSDSTAPIPAASPDRTRGWNHWVGRVAAAGRAAQAAQPARPLLGGIVAGFALCSLAGRCVSGRPLFENFVRFHGAISPPYYFYPTASELVAQVRHTVPRDKYLVIVGGASYFRGAGQNLDELWTRELQRLLGDDYAVVNFATDQSGITSFAGVAFQILAREYPRIAYITSASPVVVDEIDGGEIYRYVFWDAYYKGLLPRPAPWADRVRALARSERQNPAGLELHLGKWIDQFAYACDLWTWVGYKYFFTVWSDGVAGSITAPRKNYPDGFNPNLRQEQLARRNDQDNARRYEDANRDYATKGFIKNATGQWEVFPEAWETISQLSTTMFPDELKSKCHLVFVRANPWFMQTFTADDWRRHDEMFRQGQLAFERAGYRVVQLPDRDFTPDDFYDAGHYMASGGRKLAQAVATSLKTGPTKAPAR